MTSPQHSLLEGALQSCSTPRPSLFSHSLLAASAAEVAVSDMDSAGIDSAGFASSDNCDTPRYIPCKARYAVGSTAVLVELLREMDD
ncbi:hypothetical protein CUR178_07403 [Leishmania enriettii]|uniref:Uncharacterized protein n=1 Tax=Leishmania enriettii TaxID=5663 RepID=A0A836HDP7_LEIEN|nr:hypothetical protein CUR178_07403 [Leishmania enriettii]